MGKRKRQDTTTTSLNPASSSSTPARSPAEKPKAHVKPVVAEEDEEDPQLEESLHEAHGSSSPEAVAEENALNPPKQPKIVTKEWKNRQRTLIVTSRGISSRGRHLMLDLCTLMPHTKKDSKLDSKDKAAETIPEICDLRNCNNCVYFEMRKHQDLYMWLSKMPNGPSIKFLVESLGTMDELKFSGNCLKGSRHILNFDAAFDTEPHLKIMKELLFQAFGVSQNHPKSKPFVDHMLSFYYLDGRVWMRNYQISWPSSRGKDNMELTEIGPRFILNPIRMFSGSLCGSTLYQNGDYVSPNEIRAHIRKEEGLRKKERSTQYHEGKERRASLVLPRDPVAEIFQDD